RLLTDLSENPERTLHHPGQVATVCAHEDLAELVAANTPLGPDQVATRLRVRRADFDWMIRLDWIRHTETIEGPLRHLPGRSRRRPALPHRRHRRTARHAPRDRLRAAAHSEERPALPARRAASEAGHDPGMTAAGRGRTQVWVSNAKSRRDRLDADQLDALRKLGMEWAAA
ncbi:hypothetical protein ACIGYO_33800, partial [Streptomyces triculaminicus]